jgi:hypothetical protein
MWQWTEYKRMGLFRFYYNYFKGYKNGGEGQKSLELEGGERLLIEKPHKQII